MREPSGSPPNSNRPSHQDRVAKHELDDWLDEALADTFPASDPIASPPGRGGAASDAAIGIDRAVAGSAGIDRHRLSVRNHRRESCHLHNQAAWAIPIAVW